MNNELCTRLWTHLFDDNYHGELVLYEIPMRTCIWIEIDDELI